MILQVASEPWLLVLVDFCDVIFVKIVFFFLGSYHDVEAVVPFLLIVHFSLILVTVVKHFDSIKWS